jgi:hypothetical protein
MVSRKCFSKYFAKRVLLFRETRGVVSLVSLFHEMARFGETCSAKQRNNIIISRNSEKKIICLIEWIEGHRGGIRPYRDKGRRRVEGHTGVEGSRGVEGCRWSRGPWSGKRAIEEVEGHREDRGP